MVNAASSHTVSPIILRTHCVLLTANFAIEMVIPTVPHTVGITISMANLKQVGFLRADLPAEAFNAGDCDSDEVEQNHQSANDPYAPPRHLKWRGRRRSSRGVGIESMLQIVNPILGAIERVLRKLAASRSMSSCRTSPTNSSLETVVPLTMAGTTSRRRGACAQTLWRGPSMRVITMRAIGGNRRAAAHTLTATLAAQASAAYASSS